MTEITFYQTKEGKLKGFEMSGHAGAGEYGEDVVCAAISALAINTVNSIEELTEDLFELEAAEDGGYLKMMLPDTVSPEAELLMKSLVIGLSSIEEDETNQNFIDLIFEEV